MSVGHRILMIAAFVVLAVGCSIAPVSAAVDLSALFVEAPAPGFAPAGPNFGGYNGPADSSGNPAPQGSKPDPSTGFVAAYAKTYANPAANQIVVVGIAEFLNPTFAKLSVESGVQEMQARGGERFEPDGIDGAVAGAWEDNRNGNPVAVSALAFNRGSLGVTVVGIGAAPGGVDKATLLAIARAHEAKVAAAAPGGTAEDTAFAIGYRVGRLLPFLGLGFFILIGTVLFVVIRRSSKPAPAPSYSGGYVNAWSQPSPAPPASGASWGESAFAPPPATAPPYAPSYVAPAPVAAAAPVVPVGATPVVTEPSPFAPPVATTTQNTAIVQAQSHTCTACGHDFGVKDMCANCETPRTQCAVCGVKIWAGAMTCSDHSGMVR